MHVQYLASGPVVPRKYVFDMSQIHFSAPQKCLETPKNMFFNLNPVTATAAATVTTTASGSGVAVAVAVAFVYHKY